MADSRQWEDEFNHFAQEYRVLRYDLRGYGKSLPYLPCTPVTRKPPFVIPNS